MTPLEAIKAIKAIVDQTDMTEPVPPVVVTSDVKIDSGVVLSASPTVIKAPVVEPPKPPVGILVTPATLASTLTAAKGGETILLAAGYYPPLVISKAYSSPITITSAVGKTARVGAVHFPATAKNVVLKNLSLWRNDNEAGSYILRSYEGASGIVVEDCDIRAIEDSVNYMSWNTTKWLTVNSTAIDMRSGAIMRRNRVRGVGRAFLMGRGSTVENNLVEGLTQDGLRGVSNSVFKGNLIKNFFKVDATHRDAFQSYSGSTVTNLRVQDNTFIGFDGDMSHPLRGDPQGVGMFDGFYEDFEITGNTIVTSHYHGITVLGARRGLIEDNTVVNIDGDSVDYPWIKVDNHKDGRPSESVRISFNRAMKCSGGAGVTPLGNETITNPKAVLEEIKAKNYLPFSL